MELTRAKEVLVGVGIAVAVPGLILGVLLFPAIITGNRTMAQVVVHGCREEQSLWIDGERYRYPIYGPYFPIRAESHELMFRCGASELKANADFSKGQTLVEVDWGGQRIRTGDQHL